MPDVRIVRAIREALREEMRRDERVFVMGEDVVSGTFATTAHLVDELGPERVRNTPISENTIAGAAAGAGIFFSPMVDHHLPQDIDGLYLGGGYPELNADALEKNTHLGNEIKACCNDGMPIYDR